MNYCTMNTCYCTIKLNLAVQNLSGSEFTVCSLKQHNPVNAAFFLLLDPQENDCKGGQLSTDVCLFILENCVFGIEINLQCVFFFFFFSVTSM